MSGAGSRARRVEATRRAREDVYAARGAELRAIPYADPRQARIYVVEYARWQRRYWQLEAMAAELHAAYGHP